ncbi:MAG: TPM domain-containing protein [Deltaproteobacteria bacterium]|nr:TPM domain-containing protein [Deltaproteobacteria bacterium]
MSVVLWAALASAVTVSEVPDPRAGGGWVSDLAEVIDAGTEARIEERLEALHQELDVEVAVVTVGAVEGTPKAFTHALFNRWGIGDREANNGLLVVLVLGERRLEMETGYGLEPVLPDGWLGTMQAREMVPHFKEGDYAAGLEAGLVAVGARLHRSPEEARRGTEGAIGPDLAPVDPHAGADYSAAIGVSAAFGGGGGLGLFFLLRARRRRRERTCPTCGIEMPMLSEEADDAHLDAGQRLEETLNSVDWQVHQCTQCGHTRSFAVGQWFSGYTRCPECSYKTRETDTVTVLEATTVHGGIEDIIERCEHCGYHHTYTRHTPRKEAPSSSSSSGSSSWSSGGSRSSSSRSSFGGGRSGGGGAGSSW